MTSSSNGASPGVRATLPYRQSSGTPSSRYADLGRPEMRWRQDRAAAANLLIGGFFALARPLIAWQKRLEERDRLNDMPDYLLRDLGLTRNDLGDISSSAGRHR